jgi:hypothetical protein
MKKKDLLLRIELLESYYNNLAGEINRIQSGLALLNGKDYNPVYGIPSYSSNSNAYAVDKEHSEEYKKIQKFGGVGDKT